MDISIVIPLFNEDNSLVELSDRISLCMQKSGFTYEVIFIDDGSKDQSWNTIINISKKNPFIKGIRFQRNYGKSAAINTGFHHSTGEVVITMDSDLQDSPEEIPELYNMIRTQNFDLVSGWKKKRYDPVSKTLPTRLFNFVTRKISGIYLHDFNCGLKAYRKEVVKTIEIYGEMHRYIPLIAKWAGYHNIGEKVVIHSKRKHGNTKYGWNRFINGFLDLLSITFVSRFQKIPMHFFGTMGTLSFLTGFLITCWMAFEKIDKLYHLTRFHVLPEREITEQPLFYIALVLVIIGTQLFLAGFLGDMISRNNTDRNNYIISEKTF